jgi:hypothetical protein
MQALRVPRSVAWDALKRTRGSRDAALRDELMRLRLDEGLLRGMAEEYAAYRWGRGRGGGGRGHAGGALAWQPTQCVSGRAPALIRPSCLAAAAGA